MNGTVCSLAEKCSGHGSSVRVLPQESSAMNGLAR